MLRLCHHHRYRRDFRASNRLAPHLATAINTTIQSLDHFWGPPFASLLAGPRNNKRSSNKEEAEDGAYCCNRADLLSDNFRGRGHQTGVSVRGTNEKRWLILCSIQATCTSPSSLNPRHAGAQKSTAQNDTHLYLRVSLVVASADQLGRTICFISLE